MDDGVSIREYSDADKDAVIDLILTIQQKEFNIPIRREDQPDLNDIENFGNYTIEAISIGVGFKSRPNFINTFKTITGLTPSVYQKLARRSK